MTVPHSVELDQQSAQRLVDAGAALLLLDVPPGSYIGIDHQGFSAGPRFKGVKMLPPGPHFVAYRAVSAQGDAAFTTSFFVHLKSKEVLVRRWDVETETLVSFQDEDEEARWASGVRRFDFDSHLAPYDLRSYGRWCQLSSCITADVISRVSPVGGNISVVAESDDPELLDPQTDAERRLVQHLKEGRAKLQARQQAEQQHAATTTSAAAIAAAAAAATQALSTPSASTAQTAGAMEVDAAGIVASTPLTSASEIDAPGLSEVNRSAEAASMAVETDCGAATFSTPAAVSSDGHGGSSGWAGQRCFYLRLPRLVKAPGVTAAELTALNLDRSAQLDSVVATHYDGHADDLLGELQFAFIAFVFGQSLDGFQQWKSLLLLLLRCEDAVVHTRPALFARLLRTLSAQLGATVAAPETDPTVGGDAAATPPAFGVPLIEEMLPDSFLRQEFGHFFSMLRDSSAEVPAEVFTEAESLKALLARLLGWSYDMELLGNDALGEEDDEYAPQIVEL